MKLFLEDLILYLQGSENKYKKATGQPSSYKTYQASWVFQENFY